MLSAIGIAGMDRVTQFNVIAMSGKAVEAAGDINTLILDKTGTITYGNRMASEFIPVSGVTGRDLAFASLQASVRDETPEGRSMVELTAREGLSWPEQEYAGAEVVEFTAETRMSGLTLASGLSCARARWTPYASRWPRPAAASRAIWRSWRPALPSQVERRWRCQQAAASWALSISRTR